MELEDQLAALERRLAAAEQTIARLTASHPQSVASEGTTLTAPVRIVDEDGRTVLILNGDVDGGHIRVFDSTERQCVSVGCDSHGGWVDVLQATDGNLAVTLTVNDEGGSVEITTRDGTCRVRGEHYWPAQERASAP